MRKNVHSREECSYILENWRKFVLFLRRFAYYNSKLRNDKCLPCEISRLIVGDRDIKSHLLFAENEVFGTRKRRVISAF